MAQVRCRSHAVVTPPSLCVQSGQLAMMIAAMLVMIISDGDPQSPQRSARGRRGGGTGSREARGKEETDRAEGEGDSRNQGKRSRDTRKRPT